MLNHSKGVSHILHCSIKRLKSHTLVDKTSYQKTIRRHSWRQEKQNLGTTHLNLGYHNGTIVGWRQTYYAPNFYSTLLSDELLITFAQKISFTDGKLLFKLNENQNRSSSKK
ncbi:hypothetical protein E3Q10_00873 [Wallemia mellicola]|uniref:Uncharacterized protein n=1 Tax=Wallemia mellicola TaxID=1708541 RepID=A0A4T0U4E8_9BASI|nr:hypothetical protein E3Q10_00873 [Wallemia mellicola]TIC72827.1 hypothetical protein E3Q00_03570 [Wallemia mellicola]